MSQEDRATPPQKTLQHQPFQSKGVSHFKLPLDSMNERHHSARRCRSYTVACRTATGHKGHLGYDKNAVCNNGKDQVWIWSPAVVPCENRVRDSLIFLSDSEIGKTAKLQSLACVQRTWRSWPIPLLNIRSCMWSDRWSECCTNEHQSRDPNRSTTNAMSLRTNLSILAGDTLKHRLQHSSSDPI